LPVTLRVGIDVGGTFTDLFLLDEATGDVVRHKLSSTPDDPYKAPIRGLKQILEKAGRRADEIRFVGLGTTVATNALLERKGAVTGLITTKGFRDLLGGMMPERKRRRRMKVHAAREALVGEEAAKLVDTEEVRELAVERVEQTGIVFIDEIDKVAAGAGGRQGPDVSREGVQRDLLPIVEGSTVQTKHGAVSTDHILFIAAGAFHVAKPSDLIPELQGRFPIRVELASL